MRDNQEILQYHLPKRINIDISFESQLDLVPELEEREAAVYVNASWAEWCAMGWQERAAAIAHYRLHILIDAHIQDAIDRESRRKQAVDSVKRGHSGTAKGRR